MSQDKILLEKANDLGDRLIHCFDSKYKVPYSDINLKTRVPVALSPNLDSSLSETSTMQIEFRDLTYETKNNLYEVCAIVKYKWITFYLIIIFLGKIFRFI